MVRVRGFRVGMSASQARRELGTARYFELPDQEHETDLGDLPRTTAIKLLNKGFARRHLSSFRSFRDLNHNGQETQNRDITTYRGHYSNPKASFNLPLLNTTRVYEPRTIPSNLFLSKHGVSTSLVVLEYISGPRTKSLQYQSISISIFFLIGRFRKTLSP